MKHSTAAANDRGIEARIAPTFPINYNTKLQINNDNDKNKLRFAYFRTYVAKVHDLTIDRYFIVSVCYPDSNIHGDVDTFLTWLSVKSLDNIAFLKQYEVISSYEERCF